MPKLALGTGRMEALAFSLSSPPSSLQRRSDVKLSPAQSSRISVVHIIHGRGKRAGNVRVS